MSLNRHLDNPKESSPCLGKKKKVKVKAKHTVLYKRALTFKSVDETLVCGHSNESY